jgi:hypothetical protein
MGMMFRWFARGGLLRAGDRVEVRSREEILGTLDERGELEGLLFMPEMLRYCGQRFTVDKYAHKTCDTVKPVRGRRMLRTVHLTGTRCDGGAHGGCQASCTIFWKEAWLKKVEPAAGERKVTAARAAVCSVETLERSCRRAGDSDSDIRYQCQATNLVEATLPLVWWDPRQYILDVASGNFPLRHVLRTLFLGAFRRVIRIGIGYRALVATYNRMARFLGGREWCDLAGPIPLDAPTPGSELHMQPGDMVRIRPQAQIVSTLNVASKNRGMLFDPELARYCGGTYRVRSVITQIIDERSGRMLQMKQPCITLDGVVCLSDYSNKRLMCPRAIVSYWRPLWLEKVEPGAGKPTK